MRFSIIVRAVVVPILALLALRVLMRPNEIPYATAAVFLVISILLIDIVTLTRGHIQNACVVAVTLTLGLAGVEAFGEARMPVVDEEWGSWVPDKVLGYHAGSPGPMKASKTVDGHLAYRVVYTIDDNLRRRTRSAADGPKIRFFGEGLDDADTLSQCFADLSGANVQNYGYPGFSPAQALRALQLGLYDKDLAGTKLIVLQTGPFHVVRVACKPAWTLNSPRYEVVDGTLQFRGGCKPTPGQSTGIYTMLLMAGDQRISHADVETYIDVVAAFVGLARRKYDAPVLVMFMKRDRDELRGTGFTAKDIEDRFRRAGATVIDDVVPSKPGDNLTIPYDGHPNATADRLYARKLVETIDKVRPGLLPGVAVAGTPQAADSDESRTSPAH